MSGAPCIRGTRIPVFVILDYIAAGHTIAEIVADFPSLTEESVKAAIAWASQAITAHEEGEHGADNG